MLNLFRRSADVVSVCAVPDGGALPSFLHGADWSFIGKVADLTDRLGETERVTYQAVLREVGYYLFVPL